MAFSSCAICRSKSGIWAFAVSRTCCACKTSSLVATPCSRRKLVSFTESCCVLTVSCVIWS